MANLTGANLRGADLREANLERTKLQKANLNGADMTGATLYMSDTRWTVWDGNTRWADGRSRPEKSSEEEE